MLLATLATDSTAGSPFTLTRSSAPAARRGLVKEQCIRRVLNVERHRARLVHFTATFLSSLALTSAVAFAADAPNSAALLRERRIFQRDRTAATQPVFARYLTKLEALKKTATQAGDLQGALAVQCEIETITATQKKELFTDKKFRFRRTIPGAPLLTLSRDGSISGSDHPNETSWDIDTAGHLVFKNPDGRITSIYDRERSIDGLLHLAGNSTDPKKGALELEELKD